MVAANSGGEWKGVSGEYALKHNAMVIHQSIQTVKISANGDGESVKKARHQTRHRVLFDGE